MAEAAILSLESYHQESLERKFRERKQVSIKILKKFYGTPIRDIRRSKGTVRNQSIRASHSSLKVT